MEYPLNIKKRLDLVNEDSLKYLNEHKGAIIKKDDVCIRVNFYNDADKNISPGLRVKLCLDPGSFYEISVNAYTNDDITAFIYCEDEGNERLVPRDYLITKETKDRMFILSFRAVRRINWVGILLLSNNYVTVESVIVIRHFSVKELISNNSNDSIAFSQGFFPGKKVIQCPVEVLNKCVLYRTCYSNNGFNNNNINKDKVRFKELKDHLNDLDEIIVQSYMICSEIEYEKSIKHARLLALSLFRNVKMKIYLHIPYEIELKNIGKNAVKGVYVNRCPNYNQFTSILALLPILKKPSWMLFDMSKSFSADISTNFMQYDINDNVIRCIDYVNRRILLHSSFIDIVEFYQIIGYDNIYNEFSAFEVLLVYLRYSGYVLQDISYQLLEKLNLIYDTLCQKDIWCKKIYKKFIVENEKVEERRKPEIVGEEEKEEKVEERVKTEIKTEEKEERVVGKIEEKVEIVEKVKAEIVEAKVEIVEKAEDKVEEKVEEKADKKIEEKVDEKLSKFKRLKCNNIKGERVAVIVEMEPDIRLIAVLLHFLKRLDKSWKVQIFHGQRNEIMLKESLDLKIFIENNELILVNLNKSTVNVNELRLTENFYRDCVCSLNGYILIFGITSYLNDKASVYLNNYLRYDYVGAPFIEDKKSVLSGKSMQIGSGNFSIRKKSRMLQICAYLTQHRFKRLLLVKDDGLVISSFMVSPLLKAAKNPPIEVANEFSTENRYRTGCVGGDNPWTKYNHSIMTQIAVECSDFKGLLYAKSY